jgi:hypothetical protein
MLQDPTLTIAFLDDLHRSRPRSGLNPLPHERAHNQDPTTPISAPKTRPK